ncbi:hypothetical protein PR048_023160 [Dryococelus australis]|uniref:Uncharacterized protein n=1 Tax=Dryococelus australis TaxID=614101 RepID=A0ABQ9GTD1_9NEOP|nr:hypothetical protein PR048_023160 [Dryococelus australis]
MEQRRDERAGETGDPRKNQPTNGIVRNDSHTRKSCGRLGIEPGSPWWNASGLTAGPAMISSQRLICHINVTSEAARRGKEISTSRTGFAPNTSLRLGSSARNSTFVFRFWTIVGGNPENPMSAYTRQKVKSKYRNRIRLEIVSQKQSNGTHKSPYDKSEAVPGTSSEADLLTNSHCDSRAEHLPRRRHRGANPRPSDYRSATLPLSYEGRASHSLTNFQLKFESGDNLNCCRNDNLLFTVAKKASCRIDIVRPRTSKPKRIRIAFHNGEWTIHMFNAVITSSRLETAALRRAAYTHAQDGIGSFVRPPFQDAAPDVGYNGSSRRRHSKTPGLEPLMQRLAPSDLRPATKRCYFVVGLATAPSGAASVTPRRPWRVTSRRAHVVGAARSLRAPLISESDVQQVREIWAARPLTADIFGVAGDDVFATFRTNENR